MSSLQNFHINFSYQGTPFDIKLIKGQKSTHSVEINGNTYAVLGNEEKLNMICKILNSISLDSIVSEENLKQKLSVFFSSKPISVSLIETALGQHIISHGVAKMTEIFLQNQKITDQVNVFVDQLQDGWIKERLYQFSKFHSSESPLDTFYLKQMSRFAWSSAVELNDIKKINEYKLRSIFSLATASCYDSFNVNNKRIIVVGEVSTDGWGDYSQMWLTAKNLTESFPEASIAISSDLSNRGIPPLFSKSFQKAKNLIYTSSEDLEKKKIDDELRGTDLVVNIPHGYFPNPGGKPVLRVEEYGFNEGDGCALGLNPMSYNVLGIPLTSVSPAQSLQELSHASLQTQLSDKKRPFFLGYLKEDHGADEQHRAGFVLAAAASQASRSEDIDIICPFKDITKLNVEALKSSNIGSIVLMQANEKGELKEKQTLTLQPHGKEIRILNPFPLSNDDWMLLLKFCEPLVGCTGDMSFSEVVSNQKIPFYQIRSHKAEFIDQLIELTGYVYREDFAKLHQYLNILKNSLQENSKVGNISRNCLNMGTMIDQELLAEYKKFVTCIQKNYCTNQILAFKVKRELAYAQNPELKKIEEEIFELWKDNKITLQQTCEMLQSYMKAF